MHNKPLSRVVMLMSAIGLASCLSCDSREKGASPPVTSQPVVQFAGSASCAACHAKEYDDWKASHHALAQREVSPSLDREAFEPARTIRHGSETSSAAMRDGQLTITTTGSDGQQHAYEPAGVLAVSPLWQYLIAQPGGRMQATELAYDPAKKEWFDVYGSEDRKPWEWGHWSNRGMNWNSMCAVCHTTSFQKNYDPAADAYNSRYAEPGVGCEQCHGPSKAHVDWQTMHQKSGARSQKSEVRSQKSEPPRVAAVRQERPNDPTIKHFEWADHFNNCAACHSRRGDLTGKFQAGDRFFDHYELVLPDLSDTFYPDGQVREEDFEIAPFTLSYMHAQGIRCTDCHSPHSGKLNADGNALCLRCHQQAVTNKIAIDPATHSHHARTLSDSRPTTSEQGAAGFSLRGAARAEARGSLPGMDAGGMKGDGTFCVDCHMPQTPYMQRHWRRDHGMTVPDPLLTKEHGIPNACNRCHGDKNADWALEYVTKWYGQRMDRPARRRAQLLARLKKSDQSAVPGVLDIIGQEKNPAWRAVCVKFLAGAVDHDATKIVPVLLKLLDDESPQVQAAVIETLEPVAGTLIDRLKPKLDSPSRLVRIKAAWTLRVPLLSSSAPRQDALLESPDGHRDTQRARADLIASMRCNEDQPVGAFHWAQFLADTGDPQAAVPWYEKAIRWDPGAPAFRHAYAMTLDALGKPEDAVMQAAKAAELEPQQAIHAYALGLLYAELGRMSDARDALRAATARDANQGRFWYNLGLAESKLDNADAAIEALLKAERLELNIPDYPYTRATIYLQLHRMEEARAALQRTLQIDPHHAQALGMMRQLQ